MTKVQYVKRIKRPLLPTELGYRVLRARLSLRETQREFADRFKVTVMTINHWENGKTIRIQRIHEDILALLTKRLTADGVLLPDEFMTNILRSELEKKGNALL